MDALVMCGGQGTRLDSTTEKPLYEIAGKPMVERVLDALGESQVETVHAVTSPAAPETSRHLECKSQIDCEILDASGDGYVSDLGYALKRVDPPVLSTGADLPLLTGDALDSVLSEYSGSSLTVCVPTALKNRLGVRVDTTRLEACIDSTDENETAHYSPTGVNVVVPETPDELFVTDDIRFAVNVNYETDARIAEEFL